MSHFMITKESLEKMIGCFASSEEFDKFNEELAASIDEVLFTQMIRNRKTDDTEMQTALTLKQIFIMIVFFRNNVEVLLDLIRCIDYKEISSEEKDQIDKQWNNPA